MDTKSLVIGIASFIAGGLLVSVAAVTFEKEPDGQGSMTMSSMAGELRGKTGDDFDEAFTRTMIEHHQGAVDMARMAGRQAKHQEIKDMSRDIITAQEQEIRQMQDWRQQWGYGPTARAHQVKPEAPAEPQATDAMPAGH